MSRRSAPEENARPAPMIRYGAHRLVLACALSAASRSSPELLVPRVERLRAVQFDRRRAVDERHVDCVELHRRGSLWCVEMSRPVIGICTALERARWGMWDQQAVLLSRSYVRGRAAVPGRLS